MHPKSADLFGLIEALVAGDVEFIVVGGVACVLHGAPTTTYDLDIVHHRTEANVSKLLDVLNQLDAMVREPGSRKLRPSREALLGKGQVLLSTKLGPIDPLCQLHDGRGYEKLLPNTVVLKQQDFQLRVLDLSTLIEIKSSTDRAKDKLMVPILLSLQREVSGGQS